MHGLATFAKLNDEAHQKYLAEQRRLRAGLQVVNPQHRSTAKPRAKA